MHRRFSVIREYIGSFGFRVSKGDGITPGDTAPPEVWAEIKKQVEAGNLVEQGEGEEISALNLEQAAKDIKHQQQEDENDNPH